ncbi:spike base protein, RCAP_Rcc01079 family [Phaeovulum sp. W22_SRMD_FR3]|uniref:spike base protein, RCAP_Rcc01079 family n=1 Tax=Phaeovulum sp. W22_SRMD_FR3 TaxID=3240274 RepID=UPI003F944AC3
MADLYAKFARGLEAPAQFHFAIVPANGVALPNRPRVLKVLTDGTVALRDAAGVVLTYPVVAGDLLQFSAIGVEATGTTATVVGWV